MQNFKRRAFLKLSAILSAGTLISNALSGCQSVAQANLGDVNFSHGVASGDPSADSIILWTRAVPSIGHSASIGWRIATDEQFENTIRSGIAVAEATRDFTVKIDVTELDANQHYFFEFYDALNNRVVGTTKTLPNTGVDKINLAVFSCSNYPAGFFNPYSAAARRDEIDVVVHLGDYIYEYGKDGYATENAQAINRTLDADNSAETITLADYRKRYATYRTDDGLRALHAKFPFIVVWDDHEVTNDTYIDGAENHDPSEGDFATRKAQAIQAYYEWMPIRPPKGEHQPHIYRQFSFGPLAQLLMLDTRVIGRDKQLEYADYRSESGFDQQTFVSDLMAKERSLLGAEQRQWLMDSVAASDSQWTILGQQILMGKMLFPAEIFAQQDRSKVAPIITELTQIKQRVLSGETVTEKEQQRIEQVMAYNLDAWDGYPVEREALLAALKAAGKPVVVLAGDTHNAWCNEIVDHNKQQVGIEFATPGVSSPGMEKYLSLSEDNAKSLADALTLLIEDLQFCNLHQRGYLNVQITAEAAEATWYFVDTVLSQQFTVTHMETYRYSAG